MILCFGVELLLFTWMFKMFIQYIRQSCFLFITLVLVNTAYADVYKWVDDEGNTNYSQQAPKDQQVELIKAPPPPALSPEIAQQQVDELIEQQNSLTQAKQEQRQLDKQAASDKQQREDYCKTSRQNLQQLKNSPGRRMVDAEGNVTRPSEEERQQKIAKLQQDIQENCP